jgi:hypothetical protein
MMDKMLESLIALQKWDAQTFFRPAFFWFGALLLWLFTHNWDVAYLSTILSIIKNFLKPLLGSQLDVYWPIIMGLGFLSLLAITRIILWKFYNIAIITPILTKNLLIILIKSICEKFHLIDQLQINFNNIKDRNKWISNICSSSWFYFFKHLTNIRSTGCFERLSEYLFERYGLSLFTWFYLFKLLPERMQKDVDATSALLSDKIDILIWWAAFSIWGIWSRWVLLLSFLMIIKIYYYDISLINCQLAQQIKLAFDFYHFSLYEQLHLPIPKTREEEKEMGKSVSEYLSEILVYPPIRI